MGTYKGNVVHFMQHWTLCELLNVASNHVAGLNYVDAYAMAPWAIERTDQSRVPGSGVRVRRLAKR